LSARVDPPVSQEAPERGRVLLRDGRAAALAPVGGDDIGSLHRLIARLSSPDLARRLRSLAPAAPSAAPAFDPATRVVLGVWGGSGRDRSLLAVGGYVRQEGAARAEVALAVDDAVRGLGLGTLLLERLTWIASGAGIDRLWARLGPGAEAIRAVVRESGLPFTERPAGEGVEVEILTVPTGEGVRRAEERDRVATVASLLPLLRPRRVAVVGASERPGGIGRRLLDNLLANGFRGEVWPVHPRAERVAGLPAYPSFDALPAAPDLVVVAVPASAVEAVVDGAGRAGARALVVITAGYAEVGPDGRERQRALLERARGYGMRLLGPNCLGVINTAPDVRLSAVFAPVHPAPGPVAVGSQSGALGVALLDYAREQGIGVSSFVSLGNKADVSGNDLLQYWEADPDTRVIVLYLESFGNPRRFGRLARRVGRAKPVLVVKAGRSPAGSRAAGSHTAALAASETAVDALFRQAGVVRADTLEELFDVAALLGRQPLPPGPRVAVVTNAGGPAILAADALAAAGLELPPPDEATAAALRALLPPEASVLNPVDMIASASASTYAAAVRTLRDAGACDAVLAVFVPAGGASAAEVYAALEEAARDAPSPRSSPVPIVACFMQTEPPPRGTIPVYRFPESAARALGAAWRYARWRNEPLGELVELAGIDVARGRSLCRQAQAAGRLWLDPAACQDLMGAFGIRALPLRTAADADGAVEAARAVGYPVAVKMVSDTLVHKTEWGGVRLGLGDDDAVRAACEGIAAALAAAGHAGELRGFAVQAMAPPGLELMAGSVADSLFGPLVAFGLGGVDVETEADVVFRIAPLTDRDAQAMVEGIRARRRLDGTRGRPGVDRDAVVDLLLRLSRLVEELPEVAEVDLNPVVAGPPGSGVWVADARVRVGATAPTGEARTAP
jgi:acetyl coenzyme A synthetase (ADP forming)-like protein